MSTAPEASAGGAPSGGAPSAGGSQMFKSCWSCRLLSGGGLILSAAYVLSAARTRLKQRGITSVGIVTQITFAACLASWGIVIIADPVGKTPRKT